MSALRLKSALFLFCAGLAAISVPQALNAQTTFGNSGPLSSSPLSFQGGGASAAVGGTGTNMMSRLTQSTLNMMGNTSRMQSQLTSGQGMTGGMGAGAGMNGGAGGAGGAFIGAANQSNGFIGANRNTALQQGAGQFGNQNRNAQNRNFNINRNGAGAGNNPNGMNGNQAGNAQRKILRPQQRLGFAYTPPPTPKLTSTLSSRAQYMAPKVGGQGLNVTVEEGGVAVLRGQVSSVENSKLVASMMRMEPGIRSVRNELTVAPTVVAPAATVPAK